MSLFWEKPASSRSRRGSAGHQQSRLHVKASVIVADVAASRARSEETVDDRKAGGRPSSCR